MGARPVQRERLGELPLDAARVLRREGLRLHAAELLDLGVENKESNPNTSTGYQPNIKSCPNIDIPWISNLSGI